MAASAKNPAKRLRKKKGGLRRPAPKNVGKQKPLNEIVALDLRLAGDGRCIARTKVCAKCGHRYVKGDKRMECPQCQKDRRCNNRAVEGMNVCRLHGGASPGGVRTKFFVARQIAEAYNNLIGNPDLLNLSFEIAAITARTDELHTMLDKHDARASSVEISYALGILENVLADGLAGGGDKDIIKVSRSGFRSGVHLLRVAVEPANVERNIHRMLGENYELTRRLNDTERKWLLSNEGMVPISQVLEVLVGLQRIMLKYVRTAEDRSAIAQEMRRAIPIDVIARAA